MNQYQKVCAWCRRRLEGSIGPVPAENVTHGICLDCLLKLSPEEDESPLRLDQHWQDYGGEA